MNLQNFNYFILNKLLEGINIDSNLETVLKSSNSNLAKQILNFLEVTDDNKISELEFEPNDNNTITVLYNNNNKRELKLITLLRNFGFDINTINKRELEDLINKLKKTSIENMKEIRGSKLLDYYLEKNYEAGSGLLNTSCMRHEKCQDYLDLYYMNKNQISLLILLNDKNELRGRALIWDADNGTRFIDRIYTSNKEYEANFYTYCRENNILLAPSKVTLENDGDYEFYPYMDLMKYYNPTSGELNFEMFPGAKYKLENTDGRRQEIK